MVKELQSEYRVKVAAVQASLSTVEGHNFVGFARYRSQTFKENSMLALSSTIPVSGR
jgi:hypothetical protein